MSELKCPICGMELTPECMEEIRAYNRRAPEAGQEPVAIVNKPKPTDFPRLKWLQIDMPDGTKLYAQPQRPADHLVPGIMRCAKCKFQLTRTNLYVNSGTTGPGNSETEPCPNGCGPLWPVTWKQWAEEGWQTAERYFDELKKEVNGPTFMGEPSLQPQRPAVPEDWKATVDRIAPEIREEPSENDYPLEWVFWKERIRVRKELLALTAAPAPERPQQPAYIQLMQFYSVSTVDELIDAQAHHIEQLQAKLPSGPEFPSSNVRQG